MVKYRVGALFVARVVADIRFQTMSYLFTTFERNYNRLFLVYMSTGRNDQPKGKQPIPSAGNYCRAPARPVGAAPKRMLAKLWLPSNGFSICPMRFFVPGGGLETIWGSTITYSAKTSLFTPIVFVYLGSFLSPHVCRHTLC